MTWQSVTSVPRPLRPGTRRAAWTAGDSSAITGRDAQITGSLRVRGRPDLPKMSTSSARISRRDSASNSVPCRAVPIRCRSPATRRLSGPHQGTLDLKAHHLIRTCGYTRALQPVQGCYSKSVRWSPGCRARSGYRGGAGAGIMARRYPVQHRQNALRDTFRIPTAGSARTTWEQVQRWMTTKCPPPNLRRT